VINYTVKQWRGTCVSVGIAASATSFQGSSEKLCGLEGQQYKNEEVCGPRFAMITCVFLCTVASDNTQSFLLPILGRRNLVKLIFTKCIMLEQNELVRQYTLYYSTLYFLRSVPSVLEPSQGDGDGSERNCGGERVMQGNEVVCVCVRARACSLTSVFCLNVIQGRVK
jgi:hypothetical protein